MTISRLIVPLSLLVSLAPLAAQKKTPAKQDPAKQEKTQTAVTPVGEVRVITQAQASKLISRVKSQVLSRRARVQMKKDPKKKGRGSTPKVSLVERLESVEAMAEVQHKSLPAILKKVMLADVPNTVRVKAAEALAAQPKKEASRVALSLMKDRKFRKKGTLSAPMIKLLSFYGAPKSFWKDMRSDFLEMGVGAQKAFLQHVGDTKDWDSTRLILENIDQPAPINVDDPRNPPAAYWKARWEQWRAFQPELKEACNKLFGAEFTSRREAVKYIEKHGGLAKLRKKRGG